MPLIKNIKKPLATKPLAYDEACQRFADWCERESAEQGVIPLGVPQPNRGLSKVVGSTWHLENVNGPLAKVGANARVWHGQESMGTWAIIAFEQVIVVPII